MAQYTFDTLTDFDIANIVLPVGFTKLNYIESNGSGSQFYILTNIAYNKNCEIKTRIKQIGSNSVCSMFGFDYAFNALSQSISSSGNFTQRIYNMSGQSLTFNCQTFKTINVVFTETNVTLTIDGTTTTASATNSRPTASGYYYILNQGDNKGNFWSSYWNCSYFAISTPTQNAKFIPCENSSGEIGMYDTISSKFYGNSGSGTFVSGGTAPTYNFQNGDTCTITELNLTMTYNDGYFWIADNQSLTVSQANQLLSFAKGNNGVTATITDINITLTSNGTDWLVTNDIIIPTVSQANLLFSFAKGDNGVTATITDINITLTSNGTDWLVTNDIIIPTLSQANLLFSFAKGNNGVTATITDINITLTSNGTDWLVTNDIIIPTLSQATQLFSFAKGNNGVTATITDVGQVYIYQNAWVYYYTIVPPLVFRGITFEQTDYWQKPEMVFRGFSFEITDKVGGSSMFHGMS